MKVITYIGFTLLSILMQFCVMDFIQERLQPKEIHLVTNTSNRKLFRDILQEYTNKPHALYYQTPNQLHEHKNITKAKENDGNTATIENTIETTTDILSTTFEDLFDESASMADVETTTDSFYTSIEFENVTEFVLFDKKNNTMGKPNTIPKRSYTKDVCHCNLLFKVCDINCCCDSDCSETEMNLFVNCEGALDGKRNDVCYPQFILRPEASNVIGNLFCIAKTNLPEKRIINKYNQEFAIKTMEMTLKWQKPKIPRDIIEFTKTHYKYGDPIWLLKNGTVHYLDVSSPIVNNYCSGRNMVKFLKDETIQCTVKLTHLEMIQILKTVEESTVISVIDSTINASVLNCSTVYCTKWTVMICNGISCKAYNKSMNEPFCTDSLCTHIALKIDYIFYYHNLKIVNATVKLYTQNVSMNLPLMLQDLSVRFYLGNSTIEQPLQFSGSPGYIPGHKLLLSNAESNHTDNFFHNSYLKKRLILPINENGKCALSNTTGSELLFGPNKRTKCRYFLEPKILSFNGTHACKTIHNRIQEYLGVNYTIFISPYGNPYGQDDAQWLPLHVQNVAKEAIYGYFNDGKSTLLCCNIVTHIIFIFTYADFSVTHDKHENKILTAVVQMSEQNVTFHVEDFSTILTVDVTFIDITKPPMYEFAGSPDLNIHLPADFFFPFPNKASVNRWYLVQVICIYGTMFVIIK